MTTGSPTSEVVERLSALEQMFVFARGQTIKPSKPNQVETVQITATEARLTQEAISEAATLLQSLEARIEELEGALKEALDLIRKLRLADRHANRTGDEVRFDRAFSALLRFEFTASAALTPSNRDRT